MRLNCLSAASLALAAALALCPAVDAKRGGFGGGPGFGFGHGGGGPGFGHGGGWKHDGDEGLGGVVPGAFSGGRGTPMATPGIPASWGRGKGVPGATPGIPSVWSHGKGHGVGVPPVNGVPPIAPNFTRAGNLRATGQHAVNALHPTGGARAGAEHMLDGAKKLFKHGGGGKGWK